MSDIERLAEAAHHTMCEVSHHGIGTTCKNQRKYELIAESMYAYLVAAPMLAVPPDEMSEADRRLLELSL